MARSKKKAAGKYLKDSSRYGLHEWGLDVDAEAGRLAKALMTQALELAGDEAILYDEIHAAREALIAAVVKQGITHALAYETYAFIADGPSRTPLKLFVELPLGTEDGANPTWSFDLTDIIDNFFYNNTNQSENEFEPESAATAVAVRDALRALADKIDGALP